MVCHIRGKGKCCHGKHGYVEALSVYSLRRAVSVICLKEGQFLAALPRARKGRQEKCTAADKRIFRAFQDQLHEPAKIQKPGSDAKDI